MARRLIFISSWIELLFGLSAIFAPQLVVAAIGGVAADGATLALIRLLGAATFGIGISALLATRSATGTGMDRVFGLGSHAGLALALYNMIAALVLIFSATVVGSAVLWGGAALHCVIGLLFALVLLRHMSRMGG